MAVIHAATNPEMSDRERQNMTRSGKIAAQGMVLLKNDGALPLSSDIRKIALFGSGARRTVKGGTGSGDVNSRLSISVEQGLEQFGYEITTKQWLDLYDEKCSDHMNQFTGKLAAAIQEKGMGGIADVLANPYRDPDVPSITDETLNNSKADTALYVIGRMSGEGSDRKDVPGDYELSENEIQNLRELTSVYKGVIVIINSGGVIDTKFLRSQYGIGAILLMSQGGCAAGIAVVNVLTGKTTPSGHLTTTWAENYEDYPCAETFSHRNGNLADEYYSEGIFVGYRYFDTFGIVPAYPFGFGLSYTDFAVKTDYVKIIGQNIQVAATVRNVGSKYSGSAVVQVYYSAPPGSLEKPYQELAGFAKTEEIMPGEEVTVTVTFPIKSMASYDEKEAAWILEAGLYYIRVGEHSRKTNIAAALSLDETVVTEQLSNRCVPQSSFPVFSCQGKIPYSYEDEQKEKEQALLIDIIACTLKPETSHVCKEPQFRNAEGLQKIMMEDVLAGKSSIEELTAQLTPEELAEICVGTARGGLGSASVIGAASTACPGAAGDTSSALLESRGIENLILADGPAGLRLSQSFVADRERNIIPGLGDSAMGGIEYLFGMQKPERPADAVDYYQYCTAIPIATMLAQTWDEKCLKEAGDLVGDEMEEYGISIWLSPGMNIHRNPLCGRNFEYYSEDPLLSGLCAAAETSGVQKHPGCGTCIKHFALNNQEDNRSHNNAHCTERAIREIYLKGFEIAVKQSHPLSLMTSYNLLNGVHTANHADLINGILRKEWGYDGLVMTDWGTTGNGDMNPAADCKYGFSDPAGCIKAGNDLIMPGSQEDIDSILKALDAEEGTAYPLTLVELQTCASRILRTVLNRMRSERRNA